MIFGIKSSLSRAIIKQFGPSIRQAASMASLETLFWEDKRIVGFLTGFISTVAHIESGAKFKGVDQADVVMRVVRELAGKSSIKFFEASSKGFAEEDKVFLGSLKRGAICAMIPVIGWEKYSDDEVVQEAQKATANSMALEALSSSFQFPNDIKSEICAGMMKICLFDVAETI